MCGMTESAQVRRINQLCSVYLHKSSGRHYYIAQALGGLHEMHEAAEPNAPSVHCRYPSAEQLADPELWSKL
jgi:hypothetical protein